MAAIIVSNLGKRYTIGVRSPGEGTFRDAVTGLFTAPWRRFRRLAGYDDHIGEFWALRGIDFTVAAGGTVGIIGPNGAGKSTLFKVLSRITPPTEGFVELQGRVSSLLEGGTGFHPELTGRENIYLNGAILGMYRAEIRRKFDNIVAFAELEQFIDTPVKRYSSGMFVRLAFSVAAHLDPEILIVDEVLSVGDLNFRNRCLGRMSDLRGEGRTVLFVSHDLTSIRQLCSRALLLNGGRVVADGDADEVTRRYERMHQDPASIALGGADRVHPPPAYHLTRVELRNEAGAVTRQFEAGQIMEIHLWSSGRAPEDSYGAEFRLHDSEGEVISFGAANPVRSTYYRADQQHFVCRLGPLPLTEGAYTFSFIVGVWNAVRWDHWPRAIGFEIVKCDPFKTGHGISNVHDGDFVIPQDWLAGD